MISTLIVTIGMDVAAHRDRAEIRALQAQIASANAATARAAARVQRARASTGEFDPGSGSSASATLARSHPLRSANVGKRTMVLETPTTGPKADAAQTAWNKVRVRADFAALYRKLPLSPETIEAFEKSEIEFKARQSDLGAALEQQGIARDSAESIALWSDLQRTQDAAERALLGDANAKVLQEYRRTLPVREAAASFAAAAVLQGIDIPPAQLERVVGVLAASDPKYVAGGPANPQNIDWARFDETAATFLSPEQLAVFRLEPAGGFGRRWAAFEAALRAAGEKQLTSGQ